MRLVLLPGMDGTGTLFADFIDVLPEHLQCQVVRYPSDRFMSYEELEDLVLATLPGESFVLLAESFSTPLAIRVAALHPPNLKAVILSTGFVTAPMKGVVRAIGLLFAPAIFRLPLPRFLASVLLFGANASPQLIQVVRSAISTVAPEVLSARLRITLSCDERNELGRVIVPVFYLQARQDHLVRASCLDEIRSILPTISSIPLNGPHLLLQREPKITAEAVDQFIKRCL